MSIRTIRVQARIAAWMLAVVLLTSPTSRAQAQGTLRIGSWNIKLLGAPKQKHQKAEDLAKCVDFAKVDILALQEIFPTGPAPAGFDPSFATSKILNQACGELGKLQTGAVWKHILFPSVIDPNDNRKQFVGIAWNESKVQPVGKPVKLLVSNTPFKTGNDAEILWKRNVHAMMFSMGKGKTDFILIPVHMKSNKGKGDFRPHREAEAKELVKHLADLDKLFPKEQDIVILGDTNFKNDDKTSVETARQVIQQAGFKDLNATNQLLTYLPGAGAPFDRFFVPGQQEFKQSSQSIRNDFLKQQNLTENEFIARFSDHLMIVMELAIMQDDDP